MDFGTAVLIIALVVIAVVLGVGITLAVLISRGVLGLVNRSRPRYEQARRNALKVRAQATGGPLGDVMKQRIRLQESLEATQRSLAVAQGARQYTGNLNSIFGTLRQAGTVLENQLLVAQSEPDPAVQAAYAKTLGGHVEQVVQTSTGIRSALAAAAAPMTDVDFKDLTRTLEIEAIMLKKWSATYTDLGES
ncbi:hypothetical protein [Arthrobacter sp. SDTb3-6]|uniref:hypothetical protein n=1 Tax=Arthrobacter sp. SDTb3-6 TaxID=2713571 RepID=UPI00159D1366|nr:hypothetical protein [Arthrobacter sp. SDTb3-6]NVM98739.1 hypothetical protein [Arthrobacter sp. SDTb3-6]